MDNAKVSVLGLGSMGLNLLLLLRDLNHPVKGFDISKERIKTAREIVAGEEKKDLVTICDSVDEFMNTEGRRIIILSISHGQPTDDAIQSIKSKLRPDDVIIDGANEWWQETERREKELKEIKVRYLGMGVSGGYQSARRGPSMIPGGERSTYDLVEPLLKQMAAKSATGKPCVDYIGPRGSGHYVKMLHNGIEQGMLSTTTEIYEVYRYVLGATPDQLADSFGRWNATGELKNNFLVHICSEILKRHSDEHPEERVLDLMEDKVVQDADDTEGTGVWSVEEASGRHVPCPTISSAHFYRIASALKSQREDIVNNLKISAPRITNSKNVDDETLRLATYAGMLASFIQGCNLMIKASDDEDWNLDMASIMQVFSAGCIISSDHIIDLFTKAYASAPNHRMPNIMAHPLVAAEVQKVMEPLKKVVLLAIEMDAHIPSLTSSLEYFKVMACRELSSNFEEAQLDYFGGHNYDLKSEHNLQVKKGPHHTEWKRP